MKKEEEDEECGVRLEVWWLVFVTAPGLSSPSTEACKIMADGRLLLLCTDDVCQSLDNFYGLACLINQNLMDQKNFSIVLIILGHYISILSKCVWSNHIKVKTMKM